MAPPPTPVHQRVVRVLSFDLDAFVRRNDLGEVFFSPVAVRLRKGKIREPDVLFIRKENLSRIKQTHVDGPPDWIAEVISPGTRGTDEGDKLAEYAQAGVSEYWLLDPENKTVRVYHLEEDIYVLKGNYAVGQIALSVTIPGFEVQVDEVFGLSD